MKQSDLLTCNLHELRVVSIANLMYYIHVLSLWLAMTRSVHRCDWLLRVKYSTLPCNLAQANPAKNIDKLH